MVADAANDPPWIAADLLCQASGTTRPSQSVLIPAATASPMPMCAAVERRLSGGLAKVAGQAGATATPIIVVLTSPRARRWSTAQYDVSNWLYGSRVRQPHASAAPVRSSSTPRPGRSGDCDHRHQLAADRAPSALLERAGRGRLRQADVAGRSCTPGAGRLLRRRRWRWQRRPRGWAHDRSVTIPARPADVTLANPSDRRNDRAPHRR